MGVIEESVGVAAPVRAAYDRWTRFEGFPRFVHRRRRQRAGTRRDGAPMTHGA